MGQFSLANLFGMTIRESANDGSDFTNPDADYRRLFLGEDGALHLKDSAGAVTDVAAGVADITDLPAAETDTSLRLAPDGAGGVEWGTGSSGSIPNLFLGTISGHRWYDSTSASVTFATSRVYLAKIIPSADITVTTAYWYCGTSNGNLDFGIYDEALTSKLGSTGQFASPGTGNRNQALTGSVALTAGTVYYLAFVCSGATFTMQSVTTVNVTMGASGWNLYGVQTGGGIPLPASVTATWEPGGMAHPIWWIK